MGADAGAFAAALDAPETRQTLTNEIRQARALGADSFPALVLDNDSGRWRIHVAYTSAEEMLKTIRDVTTSG
jgi:predicted DsbA family dithiol-disulfide isomerase